MPVTAAVGASDAACRVFVAIWDVEGELSPSRQDLVSDHGFANDGEWVEVEVDLAKDRRL
jgi:hypothetical protein